MAKVSEHVPPIVVRANRALYEAVRAASQERTDHSMNKWAMAAFREKLTRDSKGKPMLLPEVELHHEDAQDDFERTWNRTLNRWLRKPGRWRSLLDHLAEIWQLPVVPKEK
jgi:hypothetical protein